MELLTKTAGLSIKTMELILIDYSVELALIPRL